MTSPTQQVELFKGADQVGKFVRSLRALADLEPILRDTASLMQAAKEAEDTAAAAIARRDAALRTAEDAERALASLLRRREAAERDATAAESSRAAALKALADLRAKYA
jgi:hypothetical protein